MYKIPANTLFVGKNVVFVPECHSTNLLAQDLIPLPATSEGTIVITDQQTAGRGQRGSTWDTEPGKNLTFSVILKPSFLFTKDQFYLNIFTALALTDLLKGLLNKTAHIKWPNDIMIEGKKVCGILIENQIRGLQVSNSVIGIGLNVNQEKFSIDTATSLHQHTGFLNLSEVFEKLCQHLESRYLQLRSGNLTALKAAYLDRLYWLGEMREFRSNEITFAGTIKGIDEHGRLSVHTERGPQSFDIKEITYVR